MGSLKRWRRIGQGQLHKWEQSAWRGAHDRRYGPLGMLETVDGLITFLLSAALRSSSGRSALDAGPDCAEATVTTFPWVPDLVTFRYHLPGPGRVRRKLPARILCYRTRPRVPLPPMSGHVQQKTLRW
jgi:hypothetical protein